MYGLGFANVGYFQLMDGRHICWVRHCSWLVTCPMLLFQVNQLSTVRWFGLDINSLMVVVCEVMLVLGISSSVASDWGIKWMFFALGVMCILLVFGVCFVIIRNASRRFSDRETFEGKKIAQRIQAMGILFFASWTAYPVLYILSAEGACVALQRTTIVLYIVADVFSKNVFGLLYWDTSWTHLKGSWAGETITGFHDPDGAPSEGPKGSGFDADPAMSSRNIRDVTADIRIPSTRFEAKRSSDIEISERTATPGAVKVTACLIHLYILCLDEARSTFGSSIQCTDFVVLAVLESRRIQHERSIRGLLPRFVRS